MWREPWRVQHLPIPCLTPWQRWQQRHGKTREEPKTLPSRTERKRLQPPHRPPPPSNYPKNHSEDGAPRTNTRVAAETDRTLTRSSSLLRSPRENSNTRPFSPSEAISAPTSAGRGSSDSKCFASRANQVRRWVRADAKRSAVRCACWRRMAKWKAFAYWKSCTPRPGKHENGEASTFDVMIFQPF